MHTHVKMYSLFILCKNLQYHGYSTKTSCSPINIDIYTSINKVFTIVLITNKITELNKQFMVKLLITTVLYRFYNTFNLTENTHMLAINHLAS